VIGGWPVQFLPVTDALVKEALDEASQINVEGTRTRVISAEHLMAIALRTGRAKGRFRLVQFIEHDIVDYEKLNGILERHELIFGWKAFQQNSFGDPGA